MGSSLSKENLREWIFKTGLLYRFDFQSLTSIKTINDIRGPNGEKFSQRQLASLFGVSLGAMNKYLKLTWGLSPKKSGGQKHLEDGEELTLLAGLLHAAYNNVAVTKSDIIEKVCIIKI